ncbi:hypothetical protein RRF57_009779 [Xylaria bambusicola]|uniref:Uncharacterized protein n=1 Tax=Xylaria bambusicola TaxID=326684 RepID=A0AAN7UK67_9PEZI
MNPDFLVAGILIRTKIHVHTPCFWVPCRLPVKGKAREKFHAHVEPEAGSTKAGAFRVPTTLSDQGPCSGDMAHPLGRLLAHDLVHVENHGGSSTFCRVTFRVLKTP